MDGHLNKDEELVKLLQPIDGIDVRVYAKPHSGREFGSVVTWLMSEEGQVRLTLDMEMLKGCKKSLWGFPIRSNSVEAFRDSVKLAFKKKAKQIRSGKSVPSARAGKSSFKSSEKQYQYGRPASYPQRKRRELFSQSGWETSSASESVYNTSSESQASSTNGASPGNVLEEGAAVEKGMSGQISARSSEANRTITIFRSITKGIDIEGEVYRNIIESVERNLMEKCNAAVETEGSLAHSSSRESSPSSPTISDITAASYGQEEPFQAPGDRIWVLEEARITAESRISLLEKQVAELIAQREVI